MNHSSFLLGSTFLDETDVPSLIAVDKDSFKLKEIDTKVRWGQKGIFLYYELKNYK